MEVEALDGMRDTIEGMELFYLAPALMGVGLSHSGKATQVSLTRAISTPPHLVLPLGFLWVGPAHGGPSYSAFLSVLWARNSPPSRK